MDTTVIAASRLKTARYLLGTLAGAALLLVLPGAGGAAARWVLGPCFALAVPMFAALLARPQRLMLDAHGFTLSGGLMTRPVSVAWSATTAFFVVHVLGIALVGFDEVGAPPQPATLFRRIVGADGAFAGIWAGSSAALVATLNAARDRARKG